MKKILVGALVLSVLMAGCAKDKRSAETDSKVEQLESRVKELESSSSSEEVETKYSKDEIKEYLNREYSSEYAKEFVNKAYEEGVLLFYNGQLGIQEDEETVAELSGQEMKSLLLAFSSSAAQTDNPDYWIYKYDSDELFSNTKLAFENPDEYYKQHPDGPFFAHLIGKLKIFNESNKMEFLVKEDSDKKQEKLIDVFNSFK